MGISPGAKARGSFENVIDWACFNACLHFGPSYSSDEKWQFRSANACNAYVRRCLIIKVKPKASNVVKLRAV